MLNIINVKCKRRIRTLELLRCQLLKMVPLTIIFYLFCDLHLIINTVTTIISIDVNADIPGTFCPPDCGLLGTLLCGFGDASYTLKGCVKDIG